MKKNPVPFGKYLLLDRINIGGMAEVWRGKAFGAGGFERLVAIKRILPNIAEDQEFISMFIDEAKITVQLTHANIGQIYELGGPPHVPSYFIAMEYIPGRDLRAIFERCRKRGEPAPVPLVCYVISKVCEGLDSAHRKRDAQGREMNVVHRDVSPQNVLISYEGEVKVIDFGIAKAAGKATKTQAGILKGKFGYMSPEQIRGIPLDRRSDVFAVGICLYELLTGERLFIGDSDFSVLEKVRKAEVLPPTTYNRRVPEALEKIVLKALARDLDERYQYASELGDELQRFVITSDSVFSRKDLTQYMKATFAEEVEREKQRMIDYSEVKAPEHSSSQGDAGSVAVPVTKVPVLQGPASPTLPNGGPPLMLSSADLRSPVRTSEATSSMPMLTAAAPLLTSHSDEQQATQIVDPNAPLPEDAKTAPSGFPAPVVSPRTVSASSAPAAEQAPKGPPMLRSLPVIEKPVTVPRVELPRMEPVPRRALPKASQSRWGLVLGAVAIVLIASAAAVVISLRPGPTGWLLIELPAELQGRARVNINGQELREPDGRPPQQWPILREVPAGQAAVLITATGYEPFAQSVNVKSGKEQGFSPLRVQLRPSGEAAQAP